MSSLKIYFWNGKAKVVKTKILFLGSCVLIFQNYSSCVLDILSAVNILPFSMGSVAHFFTELTDPTSSLQLSWGKTVLI